MGGWSEFVVAMFPHLLVKMSIAKSLLIVKEEELKAAKEA
jgi:hypothetical protein